MISRSRLVSPVISYGLRSLNVQVFNPPPDRAASNVYQQKWQIPSAIEESGTLEELRAIEIVFRMADFAHD